MLAGRNSRRLQWKEMSFGELILLHRWHNMILMNLISFMKCPEMHTQFHDSMGDLGVCYEDATFCSRMKN